MDNPYKKAWEQVAAPDRLILETTGKTKQAKRRRGVVRRLVLALSSQARSRPRISMQAMALLRSFRVRRLSAVTAYT